MSLPADLKQNRKPPGGENVVEKYNRNARRRKPKKVHDLHVEVSDKDKLDEIVSFLYTTMTDGTPKNSAQNSSPPSAREYSVERDNDLSPPVDGTILESSPEVGKCGPSTSISECGPSFPRVPRHVDSQLRRLWMNCDKFDDEMVLKMVELELRAMRSHPQQDEVNRDKADDILRNSRNVDLVEGKKTSVINNFKPGSVRSVSELEEEMLMYYKNHQNSDSDESGDELPDMSALTVNEVNKNRLASQNVPNSRENRAKGRKGTEKVTRTKKADKGPDAFDGKQKVFLNSNLASSKKRDGECSGERSQNIKQSTPVKSEKKSPKMDMTFPKYLTSEEMDSISRFGVLLSGVIRINQKNFKEAYIPAPDKGMDILINGLVDRNRALEGDEVYYVIKGQKHFRVSKADGQVQRTAAVVALKNIHHNRTAIGTLKPPDMGSDKFALFCPRDFRIPRIRIRKTNWPPGFLENPESFKDKLYHAKINNWKDIRYAEGEITKEVGIVGDIEAETSAIMLMHELDEKPYPEHLKRFLPNLPYVISREEMAARLDLRQECIFTIDPATAKDLDDAVSCKKLDNGNYQIGVHISDVTYFLKDDTSLDSAVAKRATTVYLVQKVYHMLPRELCELCSLTPGEDKLAFSVMWEMTPDFKIVDTHFARSVLNSCGKFSYDQAQAFLDGSESVEMPEIHGGHSLDAIKDTVKTLNQIAVYLRKKRFSNGALTINQTKISFELDDVALPRNYFVYESKEAHRLIEEFMLLANITVAEKISSHYPDIAFLRSHSPPSPYMLGKIQKNLEKYGIALDISSSKSLQSSLNECSGASREAEARMMVLNTLLAKPMNRANYYCGAYCTDEEGRRHYALNVPLYTHFTSPIRRYADVMVHRLLAACLGYREIPKVVPDDVQRIAENCNKQKYSAKLAGEKSTELYLNVYISLRGPLICEAVVCDIKDKSFDCIVLENGSHQRVYFENFKGKSTVKNESGLVKLTVCWPKTDEEEETVQTIDLFSIVKVELKKSKEPNKIKAKLLPNH